MMVEALALEGIEDRQWTRVLEDMKDRRGGPFGRIELDPSSTASPSPSRSGDASSSVRRLGAQLPAPHEQLVRVDSIAVGNGRHAHCRIETLCHDPRLLLRRISPPPSRAFDHRDPMKSDPRPVRVNRMVNLPSRSVTLLRVTFNYARSAKYSTQQSREERMTLLPVPMHALGRTGRRR
jgi:hypothetical protein